MRRFLQFFIPTKSEPKNCLKVFLLAALVTTIVFAPFVICNRGIFLFYGDYNVQQIPFYQYCHEVVRSGGASWSWTTDLGANFVGSYSFYLLGSPFFWLTIPFPTSWVPYLMAPLFVLKFATAALTSYLFLRRFTRTPEMAILGAMMYAFSGFMVYDVFFNHFLDVVALFPLLLIGLEELVMNNRKGVFCLAVALNLLNNYFFFVGQVVFLILYFVVRCFSPDFKINLKKFGFLAAESIIGVLIAMVLFYPSILAIMGNPRTETTLLGFDMLFYNNNQRYGLLLQSFFFPPDMPARPNFFPDSNAKWASVAAWLPLFGMVGVLTFLREKKGHWLRRLILILFVMACIPVLNSAFFAFNNSYYARWFYMLVLLMSLATVLMLENRRMNPDFGLKVSFAIVLSMAVIGILPSKLEDAIVFFQLPSYPSMFWILVLIALICLVATTLILGYYRKHLKLLYRASLVTLCIVCAAYAMIEIGWGKMQTASYVYDEVVTRGLNAEFELDEDEFFRIDVYDGMDNWPMYWQIPTIQAFHSIVPVSLMEFYPSVGVSRDVGSRPEPQFYGLRELLSVKYIFVENNEDNVKTDVNLPPNCTLVSQQNGFDIYENLNFIPMGFTYDTYITQEQYEITTKNFRDRLLVSSILLTDEQVEKYQGLLEPYYGAFTLTDDELTSASYQRQQQCCSSFEPRSDGFDAAISLDRDNLVFFSVPYDQGWTATVNGEPVEIEQVNVGFMAVSCQAGENDIEFYYKTPGLSAGLWVTIAGVVLFTAYLAFNRHLARKDPAQYAVDPHGHLEERRRLVTDQVTSDLERFHLSGLTDEDDPPPAAAPDDLEK